MRTEHSPAHLTDRPLAHNDGQERQKVETDMPKIPVKYINEDTDRHGTVRLYFRRKGYPKIRLPGPMGSPEFWEAYKAASRKESNPTKMMALARNGSFRWLCQEYYKAPVFQALNPRTQYVRRGVLEQLCQTHAEAPFNELAARHIRNLRNARSSTPHAANNLIKCLNQLYTFAVENELVELNPCRDVQKLKTKAGGHHSWSIDEVQKFEDHHPIGTTARLAFALLLYTGQRRSDIVLFGRQHVRDGRLRFTQEKNKTSNPITLSIPIIPVLQEIIDASSCGDLTFLVSDMTGKAYKPTSFGNRFRKWCDAAGLDHCSAHGLRKATCTLLAERGCTLSEIMAISGHKTAKEVLRYTAAAQQELLATKAMEKMTNG